MTPRLATFSIFLINGAMIGTWVAHIPWLQDHLGISKATLGLCMLCMAAGAIVSMPLTGHILDGRSSAAVSRAATLIARASFVKCWPRRASTIAFLCLIECHFE